MLKVDEALDKHFQSCDWQVNKAHLLGHLKEVKFKSENIVLSKKTVGGVSAGAGAIACAFSSKIIEFLSKLFGG